MAVLREGSVPAWLAFAAASVAGAALLAVALLSLRSYQDSADTTLEAAEAYAAAASLYTTILDAESAQRGYILTGDETFLAPFTRAQQAMPGTLDALDREAAGSAEEEAAAASVRPVVQARLATMQETIDLTRNGQRDRAIAVIEGGRGAEEMAAIRDALVQVITVEAEAHNGARSTADRRATQTFIALVALAVVTAGALAWVFWWLRRRSVEESLRQANQAKDEMLGMVSHELRTPLQVILGNARLLLRGRDSLSPQERDESLRALADQGERLQQVVENMLALSRLDRGVVVELEPVLLGRVVEKAAARHRERHPGDQVHVSVEPGLPPVVGHEAYLDQVLQNLLSNAHKYASGSGAPVEVETEASSGCAVVRVMDRGPGIDPARLEQIFEPFVRLPETATRADGVGLGLAVCRRLLRVQGGDLRAEPREGGGCCFIFTVPLATFDEPETMAEGESVLAS